jgi:hypothetical protein
MAQQELVPEMRALVVESQRRRKPLPAQRERRSHPEVRVDQIVRRRVEVEDREHAAEEAELPAAVAQRPAEQRERLAEVRAADAIELGVVEIPVVAGREVRLARIRDQRCEQLVARQQLDALRFLHGVSLFGLAGLFGRARLGRRRLGSGLGRLAFHDGHVRDALDARERGADALLGLLGERLHHHECDALMHVDTHDREPEIALDHGGRIAGEELVVVDGPRRARGGERHGDRERQCANPGHAGLRGGQGKNALVRAT